MQPTHKYVRAVGDRLEIDGHDFKFVGFNIRGLAHYGFGDFLPRSTAAQRTEVLAEAQTVGASVVRIFLPFYTLSDADIVSRLRIVLDNAVSYQQRVIVCLTDHFEAVKLQHWSFYQDPPDFRTYLYVDKHYNKVLNPDFYTRLYRGPFLTYVRKVVTAFRNHPAVFAWELTNEGSNYPDHDGFINFCNTMSAKIRAVDPNHMITAGIVSTAVTQFKNEPGNDEPARLYENLDFVTIHDYDTVSLVDLDLARRLNKPLVIEETGRPGRREDFFHENMAFWFDNGAVGYMGWGFMPSDFDNQDGDVNVGIDRILHGDYEIVTRLWVERAATFPPVPPPASMADAPVSPPPVPSEPGQFRLSASHNNVLSGEDNLMQALDGRPETRWSTLQPQQPGMWFELDLDQVRSVSGLSLDNAASPNDYPHGYIVRLSEDRAQWEEVARNGHNEGALDVTFSPRPARYICIEQTGRSERWWWSIHENNISYAPEENGGDDGEQELPQPEPPQPEETQPEPGLPPEGPPEEETLTLSVRSSHYDVRSGVDNLLQAIDGKPETRWSSRIPQQPGIWFEIDLNQVWMVSGVALDNAGSPQDYPRGYAVSLSSDGNRWTDVARRPHNDRPLDIKFSPYPARCIRIEQTGSDPVYWWSIHGVAVKSNEYTPGITASASHNNLLSGADNVAQALDGRSDTRWSTRAVQRPGMWFELDLDQVRSVSGLSLDNAGSPNDYPRGYVVSLSSDHNQWAEVARNDRTDRALELDISFAARPARYIRIEQTGSADRWWWSIHGVTVKE